MDTDSREMQTNHEEDMELDQNIDRLKDLYKKRFDELLKNTTWISRFDKPDDEEEK
jgi:hypothetical protein